MPPSARSYRPALGPCVALRADARDGNQRRIVPRPDELTAVVLGPIAPCARFGERHEGGVFMCELGERLQEVRAVDDVAFDPFGYVHDDLQAYSPRSCTTNGATEGSAESSSQGSTACRTCPS